MNSKAASKAAIDAPNTWQPRPEDIPAQDESPLEKARVLQAANDQVAKWKGILASSKKRDDIDSLVESRVMHRLLADQAALFARLIARIEAL